MPSLTEQLLDDTKKTQVVEACCELIEQEVEDKSGLSGFAIKAGYKVISGVKPGFVKKVVGDLLPEFAQALQPTYESAKAAGTGTASYFEANKDKVADALLGITDAKAAKSTNGAVKGTYDKLRGTAKKNVESAVPRLGKLVERFAG